MPSPPIILISLVAVFVLILLSLLLIPFHLLIDIQKVGPLVRDGIRWFGFAILSTREASPAQPAIFWDGRGMERRLQ